MARWPCLRNEERKTGVVYNYMNQYPEPVVGAFIINKKGELFLIKSHKWKDMFVIPGGHIELGEKMEDALKREIKEETGLDIYAPKFLCYWEYINEDEFHTKKHMIFFNFLVNTDNTEVILNEEAQEYVWITPEDSLQLPLNKYTRLTIEKYLVKGE